MTITWGNTEFSQPELFAMWDPPLRAAVYAIMMRPNPIEEPSSFRILYLGESGNLDERGFESHHKLDCWIEQGELKQVMHVWENSEHCLKVNKARLEI